MFVQDGRLVVDYNAFDDHTIVESERALPIGDVTVQVHLERDSRTTGWCEISIDGELSAKTPVTVTVARAAVWVAAPRNTDA